MTARARFRRDDWLELGFRQLVAEGAAGLTLERLCEAAGRTRGSFYHHFRDHDAFPPSENALRAGSGPLAPAEGRRVDRDHG